MKTIKTRQDRQEYWANHVKSFHKSGLTQRDYCRQNNISYWSFNLWKRKIETSGCTGFHQVPAEIIQVEPPSDKNIEITIHDHLRISIPHDFPERTLRRILKILGIPDENKLV